MSTTRTRRQKGWGGFGLPTLMLIGVLGAGCGAQVEVEVVGSEGELPATTEATSTAPTTTSTTATTTEAIAMEPAPRFFTPATPEGVYRMELGASSALRLPEGSPAPEVRGDSVLVIDVASVAPAGFRQWELRAVAAGETVISIGGDRPVVWMLIVAG